MTFGSSDRLQIAVGIVRVCRRFIVRIDVRRQVVESVIGVSIDDAERVIASLEVAEEVVLETRLITFWITR